jgi:predicted DNA-binding transcriptional regulator YafY
MSRPATRVLAFLEILQDHPGLGGRELAERLETQPRTVRRYATALRELGIPVEADRGRAGGYRLRPGFRMPPLMLDSDEAAAVTLGLLAARRYGLASTEPAVERALAKILRVLPGGLRERALALNETVGFTPAFRPPEPAPTQTVLTLARAISRGRRVQIRYRAHDGSETERAVDPFGIVHHAGRWYAVGHDHLRNDLRTFRLDRILELDEASESAISPPPDFDAVDHVAKMFARGIWRHDVEVVLQTTPDDAARRIPTAMGELTPHPGGVLLSTSAEHLPAMARSLAGLPWSFTVLEPPELREEVAQLAERLADSAARHEPPAHLDSDGVASASRHSSNGRAPLCG